MLASDTYERSLRTLPLNKNASRSAFFLQADRQTDGETDGQADRQTKCINTFQLCWKVLKNKLAYVIQVTYHKTVEAYFLFKITNNYEIVFYHINLFTKIVSQFG